MRATSSAFPTLDITGVGDDRQLRERVGRHLRRALAHPGRGPVQARIAFSDANGPRGGVDRRCAITVRLAHRPALRVEHLAATARAAFDGAFATLARLLERHRERRRQSRRRPKKYYAARRLLAPEPGAGEGRP